MLGHSRGSWLRAFTLLYCTVGVNALIVGIDSAHLLYFPVRDLSPFVIPLSSVSGLRGRWGRGHRPGNRSATVPMIDSKVALDRLISKASEQTTDTQYGWKPETSLGVKLT